MFTLVAKCVWNSLKCTVASLPCDRWDVWCPHAKWEAQQAVINWPLSVKRSRQPLYKRLVTGKADTGSYFISGNKFLLRCWSQGLRGRNPAGLLTYLVVCPSTWVHTCLQESRFLPRKTESPTRLRSWSPGFICTINSVAVVEKFPKCNTFHLQGEVGGGYKSYRKFLFQNNLFAYNWNEDRFIYLWWHWSDSI